IFSFKRRSEEQAVPPEPLPMMQSVTEPFASISPITINPAELSRAASRAPAPVSRSKAQYDLEIKFKSVSALSDISPKPAHAPFPQPTPPNVQILSPATS